MSLATTDRSEVEVARADQSGAAGASPVERVLGTFTTLRPGEGASVALFSSYAFLLMICYYLLKTIREPLLLTDGSAALKSYAYGAIAVVLLLATPIYGTLFRRTKRRQLIRVITLFFAANLAIFYALGRSGVDIGFVYYVWVSVFGVTIIAQFWAHAAHTFSVDSGERLFPVIMTGAALGALVGPRLSTGLFPSLGPWNLMLLALLLLAVTVPLVEWTSAAVPARSRNARPEAPTANRWLGGLGLVLNNRYLLLLALLAVLLNCVNTTGEYLLTDLVIRNADRQVALQAGLDKADLIATFYGQYYFAVNALSVVLQIVLVAKVFRFIGVHRAIAVLPIIALLGYGLVAFLPIFGIIRAVKLVENSVDYSIMNTARQALYLPLPAEHQYEGKTAIDTFFWRLGDLVQAGLIYAGLHWFGFDFRCFALQNAVLAIVWIAIAVRIAKSHRQGAYVGSPPVNWRPFGTAAAAAAVALTVFAVPAEATAQPTAAAATATQATVVQPAAAVVSAAEAKLFAQDEPLSLELVFNSKTLCRHTDRSDCADDDATLIDHDPKGAARPIAVRLRVRGLWRNASGNCSVPPLFVSFPDRDAIAGTVFEGSRMLPLTTHCRDQGNYDQYVIKEYLAYRIYNLLTDNSLRVRLARITYRDTGRRGRTTEHYAFFTEHFEMLAARQHVKLWSDHDLRLDQAKPRDLALLEVFEYMIGNTDWSVLKGHNVVYFEGPAEVITPVPFDFDFSGLVDASYAGPPPGLPIRSVTERIFRGFCQPDFDWQRLLAFFDGKHAAVTALIAGAPGLDARDRAQAQAYLDGFFALAESARSHQIVEPCRRAPLAAGATSNAQGSN